MTVKTLDDPRSEDASEAAYRRHYALLGVGVVILPAPILILAVALHYMPAFGARFDSILLTLWVVLYLFRRIASPVLLWKSRNARNPRPLTAELGWMAAVLFFIAAAVIYVRAHIASHEAFVQWTILGLLTALILSLVIPRVMTRWDVWKHRGIPEERQI